MFQLLTHYSTLTDAVSSFSFFKQQCWKTHLIIGEKMFQKGQIISLHQTKKTEEIAETTKIGLKLSIIKKPGRLVVNHHLQGRDLDGKKTWMIITGCHLNVRWNEMEENQQMNSQQCQTLKLEHFHMHKPIKTQGIGTKQLSLRRLHISEANWKKRLWFARENKVCISEKMVRGHLV